MARGKVKADCRADTRGGPWAGLPVCLINSPAYRASSLWARAILNELTARMNGYNNGSIAVSQRELAAALNTTNFRRIGKAVAELMELGLIDVAAEGQWKERQAREYRLTFVSTKGKGATNDYLHWRPRVKSGADDVSAGKPQSADDVSARRKNSADDVSARIAQHRRKTANPENVAADDVSSLICKPYPSGESSGTKSNETAPLEPENPVGARYDDETAKAVRRQLDTFRRRRGLLGISSIAQSAGVSSDRIVAFIDGHDLLNGPSILRLRRSLKPYAEVLQ